MPTRLAHLGRNDLEVGEEELVDLGDAQYLQQRTRYISRRALLNKENSLDRKDFLKQALQPTSLETWAAKKEEFLSGSSSSPPTASHSARLPSRSRSVVYARYVGLHNRP